MVMLDRDDYYTPCKEFMSNVVERFVIDIIKDRRVSYEDMLADLKEEKHFPRCIKIFSKGGLSKQV